MSGKKREASKLINDVVLEALAKWPDAPILRLARIIYNENPELFSNLDVARGAIRYRKGKKGARDREIAKRNGFAEHFTEKGEEASKAGVGNPYYTLPESEAEEWPPYILPKGANKILLLSDVHIPYHDINSLTLAVQHGKERGVNTVLLNGDIMDMYQLSRYEKDPRRRRFSEELEDTRQFLKWLHQELPNAKIYFKIGNHEERWESFLRIKAPELLDISEFRLDVLLRFGELGIELITDKRIIKAGKLNIMHGHEFGRSVFSPVNPARGYYMRAKSNVICGHNHQTSEHTEGNLNGDHVTAWSTGCLCELHPAYMPINKWNHGFAIVTIHPDGGFEVDNLKVIKGKIR